RSPLPQFSAFLSLSLLARTPAMGLEQTRVRLLQRPARQHRRQMLAIRRRRMHIIDRLELAAAFASVTEETARRHLSDNGLLDLAGAPPHRPHPADGHRGARNLAGGIALQQNRGRGDGEVAVPAGKLDERLTRLWRPLRGT